MAAHPAPIRMSFVLQREEQEAERNRIEAVGIADFQRIVAQGIVPLAPIGSQSTSPKLLE